jgi:hypothetical protein
VLKLISFSLLLTAFAFTPTLALTQRSNRNVVKVPCRNMSDGRMLIDSLYLSDWYIEGKSSYRIIATKPTSMQNE